MNFYKISESSNHFSRKIKLYKLISRFCMAAISSFSICCILFFKALPYFDSDTLRHSALLAVSAVESARYPNISFDSLTSHAPELPMLTLEYSISDNNPNSEINLPLSDIEDNSAENTAGVLTMDLSRTPKSGEILISNETEYEPDLYALLNSPYPISQPVGNFMKVGTSSNQPLVLILHTHGTEAYYPQIRSAVKTENIIAIGSLMADILNSKGVSTIHCDIMHDEESYLNSYNRSKESILEYLEKYPSIQYVFDIHRDAVADNNGNMIKTVTYSDDTAIAQVMSVVGTDFKGGDHPDWETNLNLAVKLQDNLNSKYKNIARPINIRSATFNAQYAPGSLLLEIGSCGNTFTEAKRAAVIVANSLAELILGSE